MTDRKKADAGPQKALKAARKIISTCLRLKTGQELLLIFDETTREVTDLLIQAALEKEVEPTCFYVPRAMQHRQVITEALKSAIYPTSAVLNVLCGDIDLLDYRMALIDQAQGADRAVGHMPGVGLEFLQIADVDYREIRRRCAMLAGGLAMAEEAVVKTRDAAGETHELNLGLGGWNRLPAESTGIIQRDTWGNIPSGETFIAPTTADGSIVINGTLGSMLFADGEEVVLEFRGGWLVAAAPRAGCGWVRIEELRQLCEKRGDANWNRIAELGVGVNQAVRSFTGMPLVDEKAFGTCHIAIGRSQNFGGDIEASIHVDMVTRKPTIALDGVEWLCEGQHCYEDQEIRGSYRDMTLPPAGGSWEVALTGRIAKTDGQGRLSRVWHSGRGGEGRIQVGDDETSKLASAVLRKTRGRPLRFDDLLEKVDLDREVLLRVLVMLDRYQLARLEPR